MPDQEKMQKWINKVRQGEKNFLMLNHNEDSWKYQEEGQQDDVTFLMACIWDDELIHLYHKWDGTASSISTGGRFLAVVKDKDEKNVRMMIATEKAGLFSFGMKEGFEDKCQALIFARCDDWLSIIITATNDPPTVQIQQYIQDETDPLATIFPELFDHLVGNYSRKEVAENAGETGPSGFTNLGKAAATGTETQA